nr:hypothetical protein [Tanacetum cinerariifolium]
MKATTQSQNLDDGFIEVKRKNGKEKLANKPRQVDGICLDKPKPNYFYRHISKSNKRSGDASTLHTTTPATVMRPAAKGTYNVGKSVKTNSPKITPTCILNSRNNIVSIKNSFEALMERVKTIDVNKDTWEANTNVVGSFDHESDSEEVENIIIDQPMFMGERTKQNIQHRASTPSNEGNIHANVDRLRHELDIVQHDLDADPFNIHLREEEAAHGDSISLNSNDLFTNKLDPNAAHNMIHNVTPQEVKDAIFSMRNDKSLGLDGYSAAFLKKLEILWRLILLRLFRNSLLMCISKIIANRIKESLSHLVSLNQSACIPGFGFHPRMVTWIMECVSSTSYSISINGTPHGYFEGKQGLRQGNPMSSYLFTLVMEVITLILQRWVKASNSFTYHHYCSKLNIINLCFTDDLFLFMHGDVNSALVIMEALDEFKLVTGLVPSIPKSIAYFCNVLNYVKLAILNILPFKKGKIPVKYLGVSVISTRLLFRDCKELVEKMHNKVRDWKNKSLSVAGRLQLIQYVLSFLHVYWASVFILPSRIMLDLEQLMRGFLWCQWAGNKASLWFDRWSSLSLLSQIIMVLDIHRAGFELSNSVMDGITNENRSWPIDWYVKCPLLNMYTVPTLIPNTLDRMVWISSNGKDNEFSVSISWDTIHPKDDVVNLHDLVWFSHAIPRYAFRL